MSVAGKHLGTPMRFGLWLIAGAVAWAGLLVLSFGLPWEALQRGEIPPLVQGLYVGGLYLWLLGLLVRARQRRGETWADWGVMAKPFPQLGQGFYWGCGILLGYYTLGLGLGLITRNPLPSWDAAWPILVRNLPLALILALTEEVLFRGYVWRVLNERFSPVQVWGGQALIYALLHFKGGVEMCGLLLTGLLLGRLRALSGSLWLATGMHAGWIYLISSLSQLSLLTSIAPLWAGAYNPAAGLLGLPLLGVLLALAPVMVAASGSQSEP
jgi:membrane protease YdiL (CAAX protease family)